MCSNGHLDIDWKHEGDTVVWVISQCQLGTLFMAGWKHERDTVIWVIVQCFNEESHFDEQESFINCSTSKDIP